VSSCIDPIVKLTQNWRNEHLPCGAVCEAQLFHLTEPSRFCDYGGWIVPPLRIGCGCCWSASSGRRTICMSAVISPFSGVLRRACI